MTLRKTFEAIQTFVVVSIISVLVWVYAENENVKVYPKESVLVRFVPPPRENLSIEPQERQVLVTIRGNTAQAQQFRELVKSQPIELTVAHDPTNPNDPTDARHTVLLGQRLAETDLARLGVNLLEIDPPSLELDVHRLVEVRVPIRIIAADLQTPPDQPPVAEPAEVRLTVPAYLSDAATTLAASARLDKAPIDSTASGVSQRAVVNVEVPPTLRSPLTTLHDKSVEVTFTIEKLTDTLTIPQRSVRIAYAPDLVPDRSPQLAPEDRTITDITLAGPKDAIDALGSPEALSQITAVALLTSDHLNAAAAPSYAVEVPVTIITPPMIRVTSPAPTVTVILKPDNVPTPPSTEPNNP
ncbi:MAG: hypothetical protein AAGI68_07080 [Planctomycetota bacterium]